MDLLDKNLFELFQRALGPNANYRYEVPGIYDWAFKNGYGKEADSTWHFSDDPSASNGIILTELGVNEARRLVFVCECIDCEKLALRGHFCKFCNMMSRGSPEHRRCQYHLNRLIEAQRGRYLENCGFAKVVQQDNDLDNDLVFQASRDTFSIRLLGKGWIFIRNIDNGIFYRNLDDDFQKIWDDIDKFRS